MRLTVLCTFSHLWKVACFDGAGKHLWKVQPVFPYIIYGKTFYFPEKSTYGKFSVKAANLPFPLRRVQYL